MNELGIHVLEVGEDEEMLKRCMVAHVAVLCSIEIPSECEAIAFFPLQPLELLDEVEFELDGDPRGKFECNVAVRKGAAISPGPRIYANGNALTDF